MINKFLNAKFKLFTFSSTAAALYRYYKTYAEVHLVVQVPNLNDSLTKTKKLVNQLHKTTLDAQCAGQDNHKGKVQSFFDNLDDLTQNMGKKSSIDPKTIYPNNNTMCFQCKSYLKNLVKEFIDWASNSKYGHNFLGGDKPSSWIVNYKEFINN